MAGKRKGSPEVEEVKKSKVENGSAEKDSSASTNESAEEPTVTTDKKWNLKILTWNVDGLRAWLKKGGLESVKKENPDIFCLQEIKCSEAKMPQEMKEVEGYTFKFFPAKKEGYSGVAWYSKLKEKSVEVGFPESVPEHDDDGRLITVDYEDFYLVTAYVTNAGRKLVTLDKRMDWDKHLQAHLTKLDEEKPVIYCGDLNVAHKPIDLKNPKANKKNAGFTEEERTNFTALLDSGFVDSFRELYPDKEDVYTFWTYMMNCRAKNVGWRLDYFVISKRLVPKLCDVLVHNEALGSDHCPISLLVNMDNVGERI